MNAWLSQHRKALVGAVLRLVSAPAGTVLGALVVGIALALPAGGEMLLSNARELARHAQATPQISLFVRADAGKRELGEIEARLRQAEGIREWRFVGRDEALARLKQNEGLADVLEALPRNPLPDAFIVVPAAGAPAALEALRARLADIGAVEHAQLDSTWVRRLDALLRVGQQMVLLAGTLLAVALVAVTFNTIRLQILTRREEIEVTRLLGATDGYVRRPLLYFGALQGLLGGLVALAITALGTHLLRQPLADLAAQYNIDFVLRAPDLPQAAVILAIAAGLGWLGAALSVQRHLWSDTAPTH
ncbi:MAG: ABC transporter permease [Betaproteobacteria bacterium]|nr:ABC transporter permease [Betaproteobacteria bacterium]